MTEFKSQHGTVQCNTMKSFSFQTYKTPQNVTSAFV